MIILTLKLVLFFILTSVPFIYHFMIKPRKESVKRFRNAYTMVQPQMSKLGKLVLRMTTHVINFYCKMKRRQKPRKFFTLILLLFLISIQGIDNFASSEVATTYRTMAKESRLDQLSVTGKWKAEPFMQRKMSNYLYPFLTRPIVYLVTFAFTLLFFSYRMANRILTGIHSNRVILFLACGAIILFAFFDEGRYMLFSEVLFIVTMAALFYPNLYAKSSPKGRKPVPVTGEKSKLAA